MPIATLSLIVGLSIFAQPDASKTANTVPAATSAPAPHTPTPFHVASTFTIGGEGGWDLLVVDPESNRLYIPRATHVMVVDGLTGKTLGDIADTSGVHGVALAPGLNKAFTSNGKAGTVTVFDLKTLKPLQTIKAGDNPDAIIFEPVTKRVFCFNGKSNDATVILAEDGVVAGSVPISGKPELPIADGAGKVYVNVEDTNEVICIDAKTMKVEKRFPLAPGEGPSGLAFDAAHKRLFAVCSNQKVVILDIESGKVLASPTIGKGVDGAEFDAIGGFILASNGEGTLSVVSTKDDKFEVVQTLPTAPRAKTLTLDAKSRRIYLPTAEFEAAKEPAKDAPKNARPARPAMKPGSFKIIVVTP